MLAIKFSKLWAYKLWICPERVIVLPMLFDPFELTAPLFSYELAVLIDLFFCSGLHNLKWLENVLGPFFDFFGFNA
jgi:hypothetical protein